MTYELLHFQLQPAPGRQSQTAFLESLRGAFAAAIRAAGGEPLGLFTAQLGWAAGEMAMLIRWRDSPLLDLPQPAALAYLRRERLTPTLRPQESDKPHPGGVYVLRWFHVRPDGADEFLRLSGQGWPDFESRFDARVFGLFRAADAQDLARFLLITRYADHGEWERSRDPSTTAMQTFMRRQALTVWTQAASVLLGEV